MWRWERVCCGILEMTGWHVSFWETMVIAMFCFVVVGRLSEAGVFDPHSPKSESVIFKEK